MTDHPAGDPGPRQMAEADLHQAQAKAAEAKVDYALAAGFEAQGDVFASVGLHDQANQAFAAAGNERMAGGRASTEGLAHALAAEEWTEAGHDLKEQAKLTGEAYAAGARAHDAQYSLDHGVDLDDPRRTALELEAGTESVRHDVFEKRAAEMGQEAAEHASMAEHLDRSVHMAEDADAQSQ